MNPRIIDVKHIEQYRLELTFANNEKAEIDFQSRFVDRGGIFKKLEDVEFFKQVAVDEEIGTIVWPNGVDLCPDVLYSEAMKNPASIPSQPIKRAMAA